MDEALKFVSGKYEALFYDIDLSHYGRADYDQLLANVADLTPTQRRQLMIAGLTELVKAVALRGIRRRLRGPGAGRRGRHRQGGLPETRRAL